MWKKKSRLGQQPIVLSSYRKPVGEYKAKLRRELFGSGDLLGVVFRAVAAQEAEFQEMFTQNSDHEHFNTDGLDMVVNLLKRFQTFKCVTVEIDKNEIPIIL